MSRSAKQFVYGILYLAVFGLIVYGFAKPAFTPAPTCSDSIQNQGEQGIDCGGPCAIACDVTSLAPVRAVGAVSVFGLSNGQAVLLAEAQNTNQNYDASQFFYRFSIYSSSGTLLETISGSDSLSALSRGYIFAPNVASKFNNIGRVAIEFSNVSWQKAYAALEPNVVVSSGPATVVGKTDIRVNGAVKNQSSVAATKVKIVAILYDAYGTEIFASQWIVDSLSASGEAAFSIIFPLDPQITSQIDPTATKVFVNAHA